MARIECMTLNPSPSVSHSHTATCCMRSPIAVTSLVSSGRPSAPFPFVSRQSKMPLSAAVHVSSMRSLYCSCSASEASNEKALRPRASQPGNEGRGCEGG